jgi:hypothetical protein
MSPAVIKLILSPAVLSAVNILRESGIGMSETTYRSSLIEGAAAVEEAIQLRLVFKPADPDASADMHIVIDEAPLKTSTGGIVLAVLAVLPGEEPY